MNEVLVAWATRGQETLNRQTDIQDNDWCLECSYIIIRESDTTDLSFLSESFGSIAVQVDVHHAISTPDFSLIAYLIICDLLLFRSPSRGTILVPGM